MSGLNYWQKKANAMKFGKAEDRPQDEMKKFMLYRRKINFFQILPEFSLDAQKAIQTWVPSDHGLPENFDKKISMHNQENFVFVQDDVQFEDMIMKLRNVNVMALDLEYHDDHSYLGMISLIQLSTYEWDYFIDPFTLFTRVRTDLKQILEDPSIIKVLHGCANDVRYLQRDFGIFILGVIDTQMLYNVVKSSPTGTAIKFDNMTKLFYTSVDLAYLSENEKAILTFADFRQRPLPKKLRQYALADVHILIRMYYLMKQQVGYDGIFKAAQQTSSLFMKKGLTYKIERPEHPLLAFQNQLMLSDLSHDKRKLIEEILIWRLDLAMRIDEKPQYLIRDQDLLKIVQLDNEGSAVYSFLESITHYSESLELWKKAFINILSKGIPYLEQMKLTLCNNCFENGHCAWGCLQEYSDDNQKRFFLENPKSKTAVNRRRRHRKAENRVERENQKKREGAQNP